MKTTADKFSPKALRDIRAALGLSRRQAAEKVGLKPRTWEHWELGTKRPNPSARLLLENLATQAAAVR